MAAVLRHLSGQGTPGQLQDRQRDPLRAGGKARHRRAPKGVLRPLVGPHLGQAQYRHGRDLLRERGQVPDQREAAMGVRGLEPPPDEGDLQDRWREGAPHQVPEMEKALRLLFQDAQEDQGQTDAARPQPAVAAREDRRRTGPARGTPRTADARTLYGAQGDDQKDIRPAAPDLPHRREAQGPHRQHPQGLPAPDRAGKGDQEGRVRGQGEQVPGRRDKLRRAPELRRLP